MATPPPNMPISSTAPSTAVRGTRYRIRQSASISPMETPSPPPGKPSWRMVSSTMGWRISLMLTSNSMNRVKTPVSAYPVQRVILCSMEVSLFWVPAPRLCSARLSLKSVHWTDLPGLTPRRLRPDERPDHAKGLFARGVAVAPEQVGGRHAAAAAGIDGALPPGVDVLDRQRQAETRPGT